MDGWTWKSQILSSEKSLLCIATIMNISEDRQWLILKSYDNDSLMIHLNIDDDQMDIEHWTSDNLMSQLE